MRRRFRPPTTPSEESFQRLVEANAARLYRVAFAVVRDAHLAEDIVQESIMSAWQNLDSYRGDGELAGWLSSIAYRNAVSTLRRLRDTATDPNELPHDERSHSDASSIPTRVLDEVYVAIDELDDLSRRVLLLREFDGYSYQEIADLTHLSLPAVKTRILRARRQVQDRVSIATGRPHGQP